MEFMVLSFLPLAPVLKLSKWLPQLLNTHFVSVSFFRTHRLCGLVDTQWRCIVFPVKYELNLCMLCRRK
jgi:hypothetical protein